MIQHLQAMPPPAMARRELIHDLRNLFGVVASAKHLLDEAPGDDRRKTLLEAIESAARRGGQLTTDLLSAPESLNRPEHTDVGHFLLQLAPMMRALAGTRADVALDLTHETIVASICPKMFEAAILELIANAAAGMRADGRIVVRTRKVGERIHVVVADNGIGMSPAAMKRALSNCFGGAHGTGLGRVQHFASAAHGSPNFRSSIGRGTVVSLNLPMA
jgi:signal transduction histidine kinase